MGSVKRFSAVLLTCVMVFLMIPSAVVFAATNGWVKSGSRWYYYSNGYKQKGWVLDSGKYYYLDPSDGHMWTNSVVYDSYYVGKDGSLQRNKWIMTNEILGEMQIWQYAGKDGAFYRGWHKMGKKWYYFDDYFGACRGGAFDADGTYYVFNTDCSMAKSKWVKAVYTWKMYYSEDPLSQYHYSIYYYADSKGRAVSGWKKISGKWYYFDPDEDYPYVMSRGFKTIKGKRYFFTPSSGALKTSTWFNTGTSSNPKWYYANTDGSLLVGYWSFGKDHYYFDSKGLMARNKWVGSKHYGSDGRCTNW